MNENNSNLAYLKSALSQQVEETPSASARSQVMAAVQKTSVQIERSTFNWFAWATMSVIILVLLWGIVKPGIVLQWNWHNGEVTTFEVYRAPEGTEEFSLVSQIPTQESATEYTFVDPKLIPGESYTYKIEAVTESGQAQFSRVVTDNSSSALPGQISLLISSLSLAYAILIVPKTFGQFSFNNPKNLTI